MALGAECQLTPDEHAMIDEPLARIMARLSPEVTEAVDKWTDPVLLATGLIMWGARIVMVIQRREAESKPRPGLTSSAQPLPSQAQQETLNPFGGNGEGNVPVQFAELLG